MPISGKRYRSDLAEVAAWIEGHRRESWAPMAPWLHEHLWRQSGVAPLTGPLHFSATERVPGDPEAARIVRDLEELGLIKTHESALEPSFWQLTSVNGILAIRDRAPGEEPEVHLGEDGIRLLESTMTHRPEGRVLDIGSGSGLTTCALALHADRVVALDCIQRCVEATHLSAVLNGVESKVDANQDDIRVISIDDRFDCVTANLPGVPTPPGMPWHTSADGGPDGLELNRCLLNLIASHVLRTKTAQRTHTPANPIAILRLQSIGNETGPRLLPILQEFAHTAGVHVSVVSDSRMDHRVRSALTSMHIAKRYPNVSLSEIHDRVSKHAHAIEMRNYYSSSVVLRTGGPAVSHLSDVVENRLDQPVISAAHHFNQSASAVVASFLRRLGRLPMNYWEIGTVDQIRRVANQATDIFQRMLDGFTVAEATIEVFARDFDGCPVYAAPMYEAVNLLVDTALSHSE